MSAARVVCGAVFGGVAQSSACGVFSLSPVELICSVGDARALGAAAPLLSALPAGLLAASSERPEIMVDVGGSLLFLEVLAGGAHGLALLTAPRANIGMCWARMRAASEQLRASLSVDPRP